MSNFLNPPRRRPAPDRGAPRRRRFPLITALLAQLLAAALVFGAAAALAAVAGVRFPLLAMLATQGAVAALLGARFGLAKWWIPLHIVLRDKRDSPSSRP